MLPCESPFTGILGASSALTVRAADPELSLWGATLAPTRGLTSEISIGGAGETEDAAHLAAMGESIERHRAHALPGDGMIRASHDEWSSPERAVPPDRWVLFNDEQYRTGRVPFARFTSKTSCSWTRFREAGSGEPVWVPEDVAFLFPRPGESHALAPGTSTGLVAGRRTHPLLLRGTQECIERDAIVGAWWGRYAVSELPAEAAFRTIGGSRVARFVRSGLRYRFFVLGSPFSNHVVLATLEGEDAGLDVFSAGAACRETLVDAMVKAAVEAVQGRHFVRYLVGLGAASSRTVPETFSEHAVYYTLNPERRSGTVLHRPRAAAPGDRAIETLAVLRARLGTERPVLWRLMTAPNIAQSMPDWMAVRVVVPGLTPIHGHHGMPHLGGELWGAAPLSAYASVPPHPMP